MGLDVVELVLDVEDRFGVVIWNEEYEGIRTVGDLHALLLQRIKATLAPQLKYQHCESMRAFLEVRQLLVAEKLAARQDISPSSRLDELLPVSIRRSTWPKIALQANLGMPSLHFTTPQSLVFEVIPVTTLAALVISSTYSAGFAGAVTSFFAGMTLFAFGSARTLQFKVTIPADCQTIRDIIKFHRGSKTASEAVTLRYSNSVSNSVDEAAIWQDLVKLVCDELGVKPDQVRPETRFIEDLTCG